MLVSVPDLTCRQPFTWWDILAGNFAFMADPVRRVPSGPPPFYESARMARYVVHKASKQAKKYRSHNESHLPEKKDRDKEVMDSIEKK